MKILYIAPYNFSIKKPLTLDRAPKLRTYYIHKFLSEKLDVFCVCGDYNERKEAYKKFYKNENINDYHGLYLETANWPMRFKDYRFLKYCEKKIPITIFYRDIHWKFNFFFNNITLKRCVAYLRLNFELYFFNKIVDHFFVPTISFGEYCKFKNFSTLPPGCMVREKYKSNKNEDKVFNIVFAGNKKSGHEIIFRIMDILNKKDLNIKLHIISSDIPEKEIDNVLYYRDSLECNSELMYNAHLGINPLKKTKYNDLALPVKIMDYISWGIPIVASNTSEMKRYIETNDVGIIVEFSAEQFANAIEKLVNDRKLLDKYNVNIMRLIHETEKWDNRVKTIINQMTEIKKKLIVNN